MTTDWNRQAEDMIKTWTGAQQKMWESWLSAMQGMSPAASSQEAWEKSVEVWSESVQNALEAQVAWTKFWADSMTTGTNTPKEVTDWSNQVLDMMKRWTETQKQLSESWFDSVKKADPTSMTTTWSNEEAQRVVQSWQEAAQKILEAQMGWLRIWTAAQSQKKS